MGESTNEVRADIEATRERMSNAISALERKVDVGQKIKDNPWPAVALAFGAGIALSSTRADVRTGQASLAAVQKTGHSLGSALDNVLATVVGGVAAAFKGRIDDALHDIVHSISGTLEQAGGQAKNIGGATAVSGGRMADLSHHPSTGGAPVRAD